MEAKKILVVDDEQGWRDLFAWELESMGYAVTVASDGPEAIEKSNQQSFDLIITDLTMPGMDGVETFTAVKNIQPHVKIILMTGFANEDQFREVLAANGAIYIRKPFELAVMIQAIKGEMQKAELNLKSPA